MSGPRRALVLALLVVAVVADATVLSRWSWGGASASLTLLVVVAHAVDGGAERGAVIGVLAGLLADLAPPSAGLLGLTAIGYALAGAAAGRWRQPGEQSVLLLGLAAGTAALIASALQAVVSLAQGARDPAAALVQTGAGTLLTVAAAAVVLPAVLLLDRWVEGEPHEVLVRL